MATPVGKSVVSEMNVGATLKKLSTLSTQYNQENYKRTFFNSDWLKVGPTAEKIIKTMKHENGDAMSLFSELEMLTNRELVSLHYALKSTEIDISVLLSLVHDSATNGDPQLSAIYGRCKANISAALKCREGVRITPTPKDAPAGSYWQD